MMNLKLFLTLTFLFSVQAFSKEEKNVHTRSLGFFVASEMARDQKWTEKQCRLLTQGAQFFYGDKVKIPCLLTTKIPQSNEQLIIDNQFDMNLLLWEDIGGDFHLYISNVNPKDATEFKHEEWRFQTANNLFWKTDIVKLTTNTVFYSQNIKFIKQQYLNIGLQAGSNKVAEENGIYINAETKKPIDFETAYALYTAEGPKQKNYLIASLELALILGGGIAWYYQDYDFNAQDFQFGQTAREHRQRYTSFQQLRFDNNDATINRKHVNAGVAYCLAARFAGFNKYECLLTAIVASSFWEYVVEYKEVVSINDQIITPMSAFTLGNALYDIGAKFYEKYNAPLAKMLTYVFGSSQNARAWISKNTMGRRINVKDYGFDPDAFSYFEAGVFKYKQTHSQSQKSTGNMWYVDSEVLEIPLGSGKVSKIIDPGFTRLLAQGSMSSSDAVEYLRVVAKVAFSGKYIQNITKTEDGYLKGYNILLIPGSAMEISMEKDSKAQTQSMDAYKDMLVNVHLLGATARVNGFYKNFHFQAELEGYGDFAMVKSYSLQEYRLQNDMTGVSSLITNQGYYYAGGVTGAVGFKLGYRKSEVGVKLSQDYLTSINSRSRYYETEKNNLNMNDSRTMQQAYVKFVTNKNLNFKCAVERLERGGEVENFSIASRKETKTSCGVLYSFW